MSQVTKIWITKNYLDLQQCKSRVVVNVGGAGSGKSFATAQHLLHKFVNEKNKSFLISRKTFPSLRITAYKEFINMTQRYGYYDFFEHNKSEHTLRSPVNNNFLLFGSIDDPMKYQSSEFNYIWMEEGIDFEWNDFNVLNLRLRAQTNDGNPNQMFMSLNPSDEFSWINEKLMKMPDVDIIRSNYLDNPFLDRAAVQHMERLSEIDEYFYKVYTLGEWASNTGLIYSNWRLINELPHNLEPVYGLDFGFNNPTALTELRFSGNTLYAKELLYKTQLDLGELIKEMERLIPNKHNYIYADPEDPRIIEALYEKGFNVHKAIKDVYAGLMYVKQFDIAITSDSVNGIKEAKSYKWKMDRNGNVMDEPVKFLDHFWDAVRYAAYTHGHKFWTQNEVYIPKAVTNKRMKQSITAGF